MTSPEPGWYADDAGVTRWWDGNAWTDVQPPQDGAVYAADVAEATDATDAPRRRRTPTLVVAAVAVVVALVAVGVGVWALADKDDADGGPRQAVQQLVDAVTDGDCAAMESATTPAYREFAHLDCAAVAESSEWLASLDASFTVGEVVEVSDSSAEVSVELAPGDASVEPETTVFTVERQGDSWLVVDDAGS